MMRRLVRFLWLVCLMALAFALCACQEESAPKARLDKETASAVVTKAAAGLHAPEAPAPAEEVEAAGRVLDAGNAIWRWADVAGIHAGHLLRQAEDYMRTWLLGKEPQRPAELDDRPAAEKAVWGEADAARLRDLMATMRRTLTGMEKLVTAFRKYALDDSIVDDGAQGKKLLRRLQDAHNEFSKARDALLVLVRDRSRQAEDVLLPEVTCDAPDTGQYFVRVRAANSDGYTQDAFDYYVTDDGKQYGMKCFYVQDGGKVVEDTYEEG